METETKKLKRKFKLTVIFLSILIVIGFAIAFIVEYDSNEDYKGNYILVGLSLIVLPIIGSLLFLNALHLWAVGEKAEIYREYGTIPWMLVFFICILGGPALVFGSTVFSILSDPILLSSYLIGFFVLSLQMSIAIATILIHGGSKAVRSTRFGQKILIRRDKWSNKIFEKK